MFFNSNESAPIAIEKIKILRAVLELQAKQHCQSSTFTTKMGQTSWIGSSVQMVAPTRPPRPLDPNVISWPACTKKIFNGIFEWYLIRCTSSYAIVGQFYFWIHLSHFSAFMVFALSRPTNPLLAQEVKAFLKVA